MTVDIKLINKYIERIKIDYPEDDKLMIDLHQFAQEAVKNCTITGVSNRRELLIAFMESLTTGQLTEIEVAEFDKVADRFLGN